MNGVWQSRANAIHRLGLMKAVIAEEGGGEEQYYWIRAANLLARKFGISGRDVDVPCVPPPAPRSSGGSVRAPDPGWANSAEACRAHIRMVLGPDQRPYDKVCYLIRNPLTGRVKIGESKQLAKRMRDLSLASGVSLELLAVIGGGQKTEREMHDRFAKYRILGEWFEDMLPIRQAFGLSKQLHEALDAVGAGVDPKETSG